MLVSLMFRNPKNRLQSIYRLRQPGAITSRRSLMPIVRRLTVTLVLGAPLLLGVSRSYLPKGRQAGPSVALAQSAVPARGRIYLPPARIAPPVTAPIPARRAATPRPAP